MTYILEIKKEYALPLLEVLQQQEAIELKPSPDAATGSRQPQIRTFNALSLDTRGFKFNRAEANER